MSRFSIQIIFLITSCYCLFAQSTPKPPIEEPYQLGPLSQEQADIPKGKLMEKDPILNSKVYPDTARKWWIYVPAQYSPEKPANLMIFQDGHDYVNLKGNWRVPTVFDNLIHNGTMPVTIAVFINPGNHGGHDLPSAWKSSNRSKEYNKLGLDYSNFLLNEIIPLVEKDYKLSQNPEDWAIGGASSGAIAAFTVAWERPDKFRKVFSTIGSYVDLDGGHVYPALIRRAKPKPLRVFLQDGAGDVDNQFGNWPIANQLMYRALLYKGYDVHFVFGVGAHNSKHGGAIFPEAMQWLWRK